MDRKTRERARRTWSSMHKRVVEDICYVRQNVEICDEWYEFDAFLEWYVENYYEVDGEYVALDKDLFSGYRKLYSPDTCVFLPTKLNTFLVAFLKGYDGIIEFNGTYYVTIKHNFGSGYAEKVIGNYKSLLVAQEVYRECKTAIFIGMVKEYEGKLPLHIYEKLLTFSF